MYQCLRSRVMCQWRMRGAPGARACTHDEMLCWEWSGLRMRGWGARDFNTVLGACRNLDRWPGGRQSQLTKTASGPSEPCRSDAAGRLWPSPSSPTNAANEIRDNFISPRPACLVVVCSAGPFCLESRSSSHHGVRGNCFSALSRSRTPPVWTTLSAGAVMHHRKTFASASTAPPLVPWQSDQSHRDQSSCLHRDA